jgi:hypothetical protein
MKTLNIINKLLDKGRYDYVISIGYIDINVEETNRFRCSDHCGAGTEMRFKMAKSSIEYAEIRTMMEEMVFWCKWNNNVRNEMTT